MRTKLLLTFLMSLFSAALFSGCAAPARMESMTVIPSVAKHSAPTYLRGAVSIKEVTGGKETNPMWMSSVDSQSFERALEESLRSFGLLAARQSGRYEIIADLAKLEQPYVGFDMTVTAHVRYIMVERPTKEAVFDKILSTPFTATVSDAFIGSERLRIANEGAVRESIAKFIEIILNSNLNVGTKP